MARESAGTTKLLISNIIPSFFQNFEMQYNIHHVEFCHKNTRIESFLKNEGMVFDISDLLDSSATFRSFGYHKKPRQA